MSSSARRGQVEPLPALVAVAVFALALSMYGTSLHGLPVGTQQGVSDATETRVRNTLTEGVVVHPERLAELDGSVPPDTAVVIRADGRVWRWGPTVGQNAPRSQRHVLVRTEEGTEPGVLEVAAR